MSRDDVEWVAGGGLEGLAVFFEGENAVGADEFLRDFGQQTRIDRDAAGVQNLSAALDGDGHLELLFGDPVQPQEDVAQHNAGFAGLHEGHFQLVGPDETHFGQDVPDSFFHVRTAFELRPANARCVPPSYEREAGAASAELFR